ARAGLRRSRLRVEDEDRRRSRGEAAGHPAGAGRGARRARDYKGAGEPLARPIPSQRDSGKLTRPKGDANSRHPPANGGVPPRNPRHPPADGPGTSSAGPGAAEITRPRLTDSESVHAHYPPSKTARPWGVPGRLG